MGVDKTKSFCPWVASRAEQGQPGWPLHPASIRERRQGRPGCPPHAASTLELLSRVAECSRWEALVATIGRSGIRFWVEGASLDLLARRDRESERE